MPSSPQDSAADRTESILHLADGIQPVDPGPSLLPKILSRLQSEMEGAPGILQSATQSAPGTPQAYPFAPSDRRLRLRVTLGIAATAALLILNIASLLVDRREARAQAPTAQAAQPPVAEDYFSYTDEL